jgi:valyl-tRNA synthetase
MNEPLPPQYDPSSIERALYATWRERGYFHVEAEAPGEPYVIQMPPPNVTAVLHAGHGLNNTLQDVLIRFERMRGRRALWVPGTDHAGIATQNVIERQLAAEGRTRFDLGREAFVERIWQFVGHTGNSILKQLEALGASCDWDRTYFTLDPGLSRAVREVFVTLHEQGLIYRGKYIINWCPRCLTALSNEEVEKEEKAASIWHLRYPLADGTGSIVVATTRPETMLGDTGVAVHPEDPRYTALIGKKLELPLVGRRIPIVADEAVESDFGTGAVKVTPAHDPTDFDIGKRTGLETIDVMTDDARMADNVPERFRGLDRFEARKKVVAEFESLGLLVKVESHQHAVGECYRCGTVVEPRLSDQWFVKMKPLAEPALAAYREGRVRFLPERQGDIYSNWLEQIRDWVISRQLWWGHRIPVWYCDAEGCGRQVVSREDPDKCPDCGGALRQDPDVLDTWFSSWLVPFSSLGWPDKTADLKAFYPGDTLVTAPEILFFWVARMIMAGLHFVGEVPFNTVYLHGTVRDTQHRKMSKSLGNGIDPLEVIERYGADALRYTLVSGMAVGTDVILDPADLDTSFAPGRNFANKLWNIGRLLLGHLDNTTPRLADISDDELQLADRWILARADATIEAATSHYQRFRLNDAAGAVYHFLWSDLADWYLEAAKPRLYGKEEGSRAARAVAAHVFDIGLRLLHPVMPFITETLWKRLPQVDSDASLVIANWPEAGGRTADASAVEDFEMLKSAITAFRLRRAVDKVPPGESRPAAVQHPSPRLRKLIETNNGLLTRLARLDGIAMVPDSDTIIGETVVLDGRATTFALQRTATDSAAELERIRAEVARLQGLVEAQERKLANEAFVSRAPEAVVNKEREKLAALRSEIAALQRQMAG